MGAEKANADLGTVNADMERLNDEIKINEEQKVEMQRKMEDLQKLRDEELGGKLSDLEAALKEREKETMKAESAMKANTDTKKQEEKKRQQIIRGINSDKKALEEKQKETAGMQEIYDRLREEDKKCTDALKAAQKRYEAISVGQFDDGTGESNTLQQQLMKLKSDISKALTTIKTSEMKMKSDTAEL